MAEIGFVIRSFIIALLVVVIMQVKVGGSSIESYTNHFLTKSSAAVWVQGVAEGGVILIQKGAGKVSGFLEDTFNHGSSKKETWKIDVKHKLEDE